jgi:hypothetical protein
MSFPFISWWWKKILGVICYQRTRRRSKRQIFACFWNEIHLLLELGQDLITIDTYGLPFQMGKLFFKCIYFLHFSRFVSWQNIIFVMGMKITQITWFFNPNENKGRPSSKSISWNKKDKNQNMTSANKNPIKFYYKK